MTIETYTKSEPDGIVHSSGNAIFRFGEFEAIAERYGLGEIVATPRLEQGGIVNYNFALTTNRGTYMLRAKRQNITSYERERKSLEYAVTDHLNDSGFAYNVPRFLADKDGARLVELDGKTFEVYERLPGTTGSFDNPPDRADLVKAIALYHKAVGDFSGNKPVTPRVYDEHGWLGNRLRAVREKVQSSGTQIDELMRDNMGFVLSTYGALRQNARPACYSVVVHNDFHGGNILQEDGRISGIIDFGNIKWGAKGQDLARLTTGEPDDVAELVRLYRQHNALSDEEVAEILPESIMDQLHGIRWAYEEMDKGVMDRKRFLRKKIDKLQATVRYWNNQFAEAA